MDVASHVFRDITLYISGCGRCKHVWYLIPIAVATDIDKAMEALGRPTWKMYDTLIQEIQGQTRTE